MSQLVRLFDVSFRELGHRVPPDRVETLSFLVHRAMSGRSRDFHNLEHVFIVAEGLPALGRLAAIYHDVIYFQVDAGVIPEIGARIGELFDVRGSKVYLAGRIAPLYENIVFLFGFEPGQELSIYGGLNEFLSAALATRELTGILDAGQLLTLAACIEATIPFRANNLAGVSAPDALADRLELLAQRGHSALSGEAITRAVELSVRVANSDVQNFAYCDLGGFLENTWKLLPETNPDFHSVGVYSLKKFRMAMQRLDTFLSSFDSRLVFHSHGAVPGEDELERLNEAAARNVGYAVEYVRAKFLAMAVLEALAELSGGDTPIAYFTGAADSGERQLHEYLPAVSAFAQVHEAVADPTVLNVLKFGRRGETRFDTQASPIAAYFYEALSPSGMERMVKEAKKVCAGMRSWDEFLARLPGPLVAAVARAAAEIAVGRRERLLELADRYQSGGRHGRKRAA